MELYTLSAITPDGLIKFMDKPYLLVMKFTHYEQFVTAIKVLVFFSLLDGKIFVVTRKEPVGVCGQIIPWVTCLS